MSADHTMYLMKGVLMSAMAVLCCTSNRVTCGQHSSWSQLLSTSDQSTGHQAGRPHLLMFLFSVLPTAISQQG